MVRTFRVISSVIWPTILPFGIVVVMMHLQPRVKIIKTAPIRQLEKSHLLDVEYNKELFRRFRKNEWKMNRQLPLIFVGGMPRSGTTLLRVMLDAHNEVRCGPETRVIPKILSMHDRLQQSGGTGGKSEHLRVVKDVLDQAVGSFIFEVIVRHGPLAPRLCNKDPFILKYGASLINLFPKAKFIYLVRDGRAATHSMVSRNLKLNLNYTLTDYRTSLRYWNRVTSEMHHQCQLVGPLNCLIVHYEALVLQPRLTMQRICSYLDLGWDENVMHHEKLVGTEVVLPTGELSSRQAAKPIYKDALKTWFDYFPKDVLDEAAQVAPMLTILGYDLTNRPTYQNLVQFQTTHMSM